MLSWSQGGTFWKVSFGGTFWKVASPPGLDGYVRVHKVTAAMLLISPEPQGNAHGSIAARSSPTHL